ncbi:MAG TPA: hypothetical protein PK332_10435 [Chitinophagales bacterium]|nr:hypothetical protein [Chitinophagales bacterium]
MSKDNKKYFLVFVAVIIVIIAYFLLRDYNEKWNLNFDKTKKNAYGTYITYEILKHNNDSNFIEINNSVISTFRTLDKNKKYNYVFINYANFYDSATIDTICKFVENGNTAFLAVEDIYYSRILSDSILEQQYHLRTNTDLFSESDTIVKDKNSARFNFINPSLQNKDGYCYYVRDEYDTIQYAFNHFEANPDSEWTATNNKEKELLLFGNKTVNHITNNFISLKHGKGNFIILLSAIPFTNYFMRKQEGLEYAEKVFAHLPNNTIIWDNVSQYEKEEINDDRINDSRYNESALYFILNNRSLRWAWYLCLLGVLIYVIFQAKRRQNIIPLIETKQNTSLQYVQTIGQLYYQDKAHQEIAKEMKLQFLNFLRNKYNCKTNEIDKVFMQQIAIKSNIDKEKIASIFNHFNNIETVNTTQLHQLNTALEYFYKNCK